MALPWRPERRCLPSPRRRPPQLRAGPQAPAAVRNRAPRAVPAMLLPWLRCWKAHCMKGAATAAMPWELLPCSARRWTGRPRRRPGRAYVGPRRRRGWRMASMACRRVPSAYPEDAATLGTSVPAWIMLSTLRRTRCDPVEVSAWKSGALQRVGSRTVPPPARAPPFPQAHMVRLPHHLANGQTPEACNHHRRPNKTMARTAPILTASLGMVKTKAARRGQPKTMLTSTAFLFPRPSPHAVSLLTSTAHLATTTTGVRRRLWKMSTC
mmetsp:Transcript_113847/g.327148  ORF Transcript_113847/g.327148 Transcript_113847/m.327148 type:complete len:267 (+) Transcript_113847:1044-1844(+)